LIGQQVCLAIAVAEQQPQVIDFIVPFGTAVSAGRRLGYGFVLFENGEQAQAAIAGMNGERESS